MQANFAAETVKGAELAEAQQQEEVASTAKQVCLLPWTSYCQDACISVRCKSSQLGACLWMLCSCGSASWSRQSWRCSNAWPRMWRRQQKSGESGTPCLRESSSGSRVWQSARFSILTCCALLHVLMHITNACGLGRNTVTTLNGSLTALKEQIADAEEELGVHQRAAPKEVAQMQGLQV